MIFKALLFLFFSNQSSAQISDLVACEKQTESLLCVTDFIEPDFSKPFDPVQWIEKDQGRVCKPNKEDIKNYFMTIYKSTPALVQQLICNLKVIYLEEGTNEAYGARVGMFFDTKDIKNELIADGMKSFDIKALGQILYVNVPGRITTKETCSEAAQRRINAYFGILPTATSIGQLPQYFFKKDYVGCDFEDTLIHEAGHIFDFANKKISFDPSWTSLAFDLVPTVIDGQTYDLQIAKFDANLLSNMQSNQLKIEDAIPLVNALSKSPFVSFYSMYHPTEDFAEEFAFSLGGNHFSLIDTTLMTIFDTVELSKSIASRINKVNYLNNAIKVNTKIMLEPYYENIKMPIVTSKTRSRKQPILPNY